MENLHMGLQGLQGFPFRGQANDLHHGRDIPHELDRFCDLWT